MATDPGRKPNRGWIWYFVILAVLTVVATTVLVVYNLRQQLRPEQLAAARKLWDEKRPADYVLTYTKKGNATGTFVVTVRKGKVVSVLMREEVKKDNEVVIVEQPLERRRPLGDQAQDHREEGHRGHVLEVVRQSPGHRPDLRAIGPGKGLQLVQEGPDRLGGSGSRRGSRGLLRGRLGLPREGDARHVTFFSFFSSLFFPQGIAWGGGNPLHGVRRPVAWGRARRCMGGLKLVARGLAPDEMDDPAARPLLDRDPAGGPERGEALLEVDRRRRWHLRRPAGAAQHRLRLVRFERRPHRRRLSFRGHALLRAFQRA